MAGIERRAGEAPDRLLHMGPEALLAPVHRSGPDHVGTLGQQPLDLQVVERRKQLAGGEVTGRTHDHDVLLSRPRKRHEPVGAPSLGRGVKSATHRADSGRADLDHRGTDRCRDAEDEDGRGRPGRAVPVDGEDRRGNQAQQADHQQDDGGPVRGIQGGLPARRLGNAGTEPGHREDPPPQRAGHIDDHQRAEDQTEAECDRTFLGLEALGNHGDQRGDQQAHQDRDQAGHVGPAQEVQLRDAHPGKLQPPGRPGGPDLRSVEPLIDPLRDGQPAHDRLLPPQLAAPVDDAGRCQQSWLGSGVEAALLLAAVGKAQAKQSAHLAVPGVDGKPADHRPVEGDGAADPLRPQGPLVASELVGHDPAYRRGVWALLRRRRGRRGEIGVSRGHEAGLYCAGSPLIDGLRSRRLRKEGPGPADLAAHAATVRHARAGNPRPRAWAARATASPGSPASAKAAPPLPVRCQDVGLVALRRRPSAASSAGWARQAAASRSEPQRLGSIDPPRARSRASASGRAGPRHSEGRSAAKVAWVPLRPAAATPRWREGWLIGSSRSPAPPTKRLPPARQAGTSLPSESARRRRSGSWSGRPPRRRSTTAASAEPPPRPASTGRRFSSRSRAAVPGRRASSARAARSTRLSSSGTSEAPGPETTSSQPEAPSHRRSWAPTRSCQSRRTTTERRSWRPSGRRPTTLRARLSLAKAGAQIMGGRSCDGSFRRVFHDAPPATGRGGRRLLYSTLTGLRRGDGARLAAHCQQVSAWPTLAQLGSASASASASAFATASSAPRSGPGSVGCAGRWSAVSSPGSRRSCAPPSAPSTRRPRKGSSTATPPLAASRASWRWPHVSPGWERARRRRRSPALPPPVAQRVGPPSRPRPAPAAPPRSPQPRPALPEVPLRPSRAARATRAALARNRGPAEQRCRGRPAAHGRPQRPRAVPTVLAAPRANRPTASRSSVSPALTAASIRCSWTSQPSTTSG